MCAIFRLLWVRKLIGKPRVPYNRGLRVRGSSHPIYNRDYEPFLPPFAAARKVFRIQSDLLCRASYIACSSRFASGGVSRTATSYGRPQLRILQFLQDSWLNPHDPGNGGRSGKEHPDRFGIGQSLWRIENTSKNCRA